MPSHSFRTKYRIIDEDSQDYDDRLGNAHTTVGHFVRQLARYLQRHVQDQEAERLQASLLYRRLRCLR